MISLISSQKMSQRCLWINKSKNKFAIILWITQLALVENVSIMCVFRCVCPDGFEGDECEINIDDCEDNDCENNSTCVDGINNYTCLCSPEYTGNSQTYTCECSVSCVLCLYVWCWHANVLLELTCQTHPLYFCFSVFLLPFLCLFC